MGRVLNATHRPLYPWERDPVPIVQEAGWAPGPVWTGAENLTPTGICFYSLVLCTSSVLGSLSWSYCITSNYIIMAKPNPNLTRAIILTVVTWWLNCANRVSQFSHPWERRSETSTIRDKCTKVVHNSFSIYISWKYVLIVQFHTNISNKTTLQ